MQKGVNNCASCGYKLVQPVRIGSVMRQSLFQVKFAVIQPPCEACEQIHEVYFVHPSSLEVCMGAKIMIKIKKCCLEKVSNAT